MGLQDMLLMARLFPIPIKVEEEDDTDNIVEITCYNKRLFSARMLECGIIKHKNKFNPFTKNYRNMVSISNDDEQDRIECCITITTIDDRIIYCSQQHNIKRYYIFTKNTENRYIGHTVEYTHNYIQDDNGEYSWEINTSHQSREYYIFKFDRDLINVNISDPYISFSSNTTGLSRYNINDDTWDKNEPDNNKMTAIEWIYNIH